MLHATRDGIANHRKLHQISQTSKFLQLCILLGKEGRRNGEGGRRKKGGEGRVREVKEGGGSEELLEGSSQPIRHLNSV